MLKICNITKKYSSDSFEQVALNDVSMNFRKSEFVSILGQSGSGKTTLLNIIGGLDQYDSGDLVINGISTKEYKDRDWDAYRNHSIGFVFQSYNLIGHQSVLSNVEIALTLSGVKKSERKERAIEALKQVGLEDHIYKKPNQLSGGQMQRVAIARALINNPDIILADEPTGALDSDTSVQIMEILKKIANKKLVIMVTHNPELAEEYSTRIIRVKDGKIIGDTRPYSDAEYDADNAVLSDEELKNANDAVLQRLTPLAEDHLDNAKIQKHEKAKKAKKQKTSMGFLTALSLSLNNLMTKKGRTTLTAFAGSIGIIGIALILAISTGVNNYIDEVQQDTLSSYPIQIMKETTDMSALMENLMGIDANGETEEDGEPEERNAVYANPIMFRMMKSMMNAEVNTNNLKDFKVYLDEHHEEISQYTTAMQYGYDISLNVYAKDANNKYAKADFFELMQNVLGGESSGMVGSITSVMSSASSVTIWQELLTDPATGDVSALITDQYDLVHGKWPTEKNEVLLVLTSNNEISDLTLYALGLVDQDTMMSSTMAAMTGKAEDTAFDEIIGKSWSYEDICAIPLKMILPTDYYRYDSALGLWVDISDNEALLNSVIDKGLELHVAGIIKPKEDSTPTLNGSLCYTSALTEYYIEQIGNSEMIQSQMSEENANKNIITGLPFVLDEEDVELAVPEKVEAFKGYVAELTDNEKAALYEDILANPDETVMQETIDSLMEKYQEMTAEEIVDDIKKSYSDQLGYSEDLIGGMLSDYDKEELLELLETTAKEMILESYKQSAKDKINALKKIPTDEELKSMREMIEAEMYASLKDVPEKQLQAAKFTIQLGYIAQNWMQSTGMSQNAIMTYLYTLNATEVNEIFEKLLNETATNMYAEYSGMSSDADNAKKVAEAFDKYLEDCTDEDLAYFYDNNMPDKVSSTSYADMLKELGLCTLEDPSYIYIYPKDFEMKENVAQIIRDYNASVENEEDKIEYTDIVAMLMSSVSTIINAISVVLISFVSISLIVSSIMIGIITYISVLERTKEIGILRAVGASKGDISSVFNAETMIVGLLAGIVGIVSTVLLCIPINIIARAVTDISSLTAVLPWYGYLLIVLSVVLTLIAGLFPAMMAAKKDPVIALRTE